MPEDAASWTRRPHRSRPAGRQAGMPRSPDGRRSRHAPARCGRVRRVALRRGPASVSLLRVDQKCRRPLDWSVWVEPSIVARGRDRSHPDPWRAAKAHRAFSLAPPAAVSDRPSGTARSADQPSSSAFSRRKSAWCPSIASIITAGGERGEPGHRCGRAVSPAPTAPGRGDSLNGPAPGRGQPGRRRGRFRRPGACLAGEERSRQIPPRGPALRGLAALALAHAASANVRDSETWQSSNRRRTARGPGINTRSMFWRAAELASSSTP